MHSFTCKIFSLLKPWALSTLLRETPLREPRRERHTERSLISIPQILHFCILTPSYAHFYSVTWILINELLILMTICWMETINSYCSWLINEWYGK